MTPELAQKLKEAGFPQDPNDLINEVEYKGKKYTKPTEPSLSELIEACGDKFDSLGRRRDGWVSLSFDPTPDFQGFETLSPTLRIVGSTPEEAVANLWLELNRIKR